MAHFLKYYGVFVLNNVGKYEKPFERKSYLENLSHQTTRGEEEWIHEKAIEKWQLNVLYY